MVRWLRWHCPPDTGFEIRALAVWGRARYLSVTEAPHNTGFHTWMGKKHFCSFQTAETGNRTPDSGVKGSGANHYPRAPALVSLIKSYNTSSSTCIITSQACLHLGSWIRSTPYFCLWENRSFKSTLEIFYLFYFILFSKLADYTGWKQGLREKLIPSQQTQNLYITFIQCRPNVFDVGPTLYKCYTIVLCLPCLLGYCHP